jgi:uncharacterized protein
MPEFLDLTFVYTVVAVILAGLIRGFTGFGSAMVMAPVLVHLVGPAQAVATTLALEFVVSIQLIPAAWQHRNLKMLAPLGIGAWIFAPVGVWLVVRIDEEIMRQVVSIIVLSFVIILSLGWRYQGSVKGSLSLLIGSLSGLLSGATSMGGPPVILYMMSGPNDPVKIRSTIILFFVISIFPSLGSLIWAGVLDGEVVFRVALLAPPFMIAAWIGSRFFHIASETFFRRLTLGLLTIIAVASLLA